MLCAPLRLLVLFGLALLASPAVAATVRVGILANGVRVGFTDGPDGFALSIGTKTGSRITGARPVRIELFRSERDIRTLDLAYRAVERSGDIVIARASLSEGGAVLDVEDRYRIVAQVLRIERTVRIKGDAPGVGFTSGLILSAPDGRFARTQFFAPGVLYAGPGSNNAGGPAGSAAFAKGHVAMREDALPAPMIGFLLPGGLSVALLNPEPVANTSEEDTRASAASVLIDDRFRFGAFGAAAGPGGSVEFGYWLPGSIIEPVAAGGAPRRRYAPLKASVRHDYRLDLRIGAEKTMPAFMHGAWRWAYAALAPKPAHLDIAQARRVLTDHLADRAVTIDGRTGLPWIHQITTGKVWHRPDDMRAAIGFVGKNLEVADILLIEADHDSGPRGTRLRNTALSIIDTFTRGLTMAPPSGEAIDLATGRATVSFPPSTWRGNADAGSRVFVRALSEDLRKLTDAYLREKRQGRDHPEWLRWVTDFADWLLPQQRPNGSFPRAWAKGTGLVVEESSSASYAPVPLLAVLSQAHRAAGTRYRDAAIRAADFVWRTQGDTGVFTGATLDFPDVIDKEAGMLSMEAFLATYDLTGDRRWIDRATVAADFAETWMYVWNVPMADDAIDAELHWKKGVPTTGVNVVVIGGRGLVDQYLDWSAPAYARLYHLTGDRHYRDVAQILLRNTKAMLALPGRTYDTAGPGWQQENFDLSLRRGYGGHRAWLPWVSVHHLWSIIGIEMLDPALLADLAGDPALLADLADEPAR